MLYAALVGCLFVFLVANLLVRLPGGFAWVATFCVGCGFFSLLAYFFSPAILINAGLLFLGAVVCGSREAKLTKFHLWTVASLLISLTCSSGLALQDVWSEHHLQRKYPFESLNGRLAYESEPPPSPIDGVTPPRLSRLQLTKATHERMEVLESRIPVRGGLRRSEALRRIHGTAVERFIDSSGFGVGRMTHMREYVIERVEEPTPMPLPTPPGPMDDPATVVPPVENTAANAAGALAADGEAAPVSREDVAKLHNASYRDFSNFGGFGYLRDRDHVAGFQPHGFRELPQLKLGPGNLAPDTNWVLVRLDLMGLLKHNPPRAYVSRNLPRMEELKTAPTRELDAFEQHALTELARGEDLVFDEEPHRLRMVGSLRAINQCLQCHQIERGGLLGAFSYEFRRTPAPRREQPPAEPPPIGAAERAAPNRVAYGLSRSTLLQGATEVFHIR